MRSITESDLRDDFEAILREVQCGQTLIVTRNGIPIAELRPILPRRFIPRDVITGAAGRIPRIDGQGFRKDSDGVIDPQIGI